MDWEGLNPPYRTIVADPPWHYDGFNNYGPGHGDWRPADLPYSSMSIDQIAALPVQALADADCRLFLWTTNKYLPDAFDISEMWGFDYKQLLVWHKVDSNLSGSVAANSAEFLLVCVKGKPERLSTWSSAVLQRPHGRTHSEKPSVFLDLVEQVSPGPYVELFCRRPRLGWDAWGHGYETALIGPPSDEGDG